jgi:hypothetical protein
MFNEIKQNASLSSGSIHARGSEFELLNRKGNYETSENRKLMRADHYQQIHVLKLAKAERTYEQAKLDYIDAYIKCEPVHEFGGCRTCDHGKLKCKWMCGMLCATCKTLRPYLVKIDDSYTALDLLRKAIIVYEAVAIAETDELFDDNVFSVVDEFIDKGECI